MLCVDLAILKFPSYMHRTDIGPAANPSSKLQAAFALRAIELSVHHFRFHFHFYFRFTPSPCHIPRQPAPACVLFAAYCIWRPFHIVLLPCFCLSLPLSAEFNCVLYVECGGREGQEGQAGRKGSAVTPSTNGNELVLHCATWPATNLIQLVGIAMRLNGIYLFNCRAPTKHKALFCLIILLRLREPTCTRTKSISACCCCCWHCLAFYKNRKVKSIFTCCIALRCATLK